MTVYKFTLQQQNARWLNNKMIDVYLLSNTILLSLWIVNYYNESLQMYNVSNIIITTVNITVHLLPTYTRWGIFTLSIEPIERMPGTIHGCREHRIGLPLLSILFRSIESVTMQPHPVIIPIIITFINKSATSMHFDVDYIVWSTISLCEYCCSF